MSGLDTQRLADVCEPFRSLAIAGTAKNAGKTTALNFLVHALTERGHVLGLSSVGRDGEAVDQITNRPKPRIRPPMGTLVATSHESALYSQATLRLLESTPFRTALGPVGIYRVDKVGFVEVAGPVKVREATLLLGMLLNCGADKVLLDGAADRRTFISCGVEGFVLATGLVTADDLSGVVAETQRVLQCLQLPAPPLEWAKICMELSSPGAVMDHGLKPWLASTFLGDFSGYLNWLPQGCRALFVPGALVDGLLETLLKGAHLPAIVVSSGTHVLAAQTLLERYFRRGGKLFSLNPLRASALTVNPTAPDGRSCDPAELLAVMQHEFPGLPVVDVGPHW